MAAPDGKTFTILVIGRDGRACAIAVGKDWDPGVNPEGGEKS